MSIHKPTHQDTIAKKPPRPIHVENTTDATRGEPLATRAQKRRAELEQALAKLDVAELRERSDIENAVTAVDELLTGDLVHLGDATAAALNRWLENTKHLAESNPKSRRQSTH